MSRKAYPSNKDSGIEWLGCVPDHWWVYRLKRLATLVTEKAEAQTAPVALENIEGWTGRFRPSETQYEGDGIAFKAGDILFGKLRPYLAKVFLCQLSGEAVGDFHVLRPAPDMAGRFLQYLMLTREFIVIVDGSTYGAKMPRASWDFMGQMELPKPPLPEQRAIADFLDRETAKIDALVAEQERLIALLAEKRRTVISHAVTKGLDPNAPMKDSGISWLGEVPAHWEVRPIKHIASVKGRIGFRGYTTEDLVADGEGPIALGGANIGLNGSLDLGRLTYISWDKYEESPEIKVFHGDVIVGQRGSCGEVALIAGDIGPATINPSLVIIRPAAISGNYLSYSMQSDATQSTFQSFLNATAVPMLSQMQIGSVPVCAPGGEEQRRIVTHLDRETTKLDTLTAEAERAIALLKERRAALISAAVTGKIDVRDAVEAEEVAA